MNLTLTNNLGDPVPVMSEQEGGWADALMPNTPTTLSHTASDVVIIGDKPSVTDQIKQALGTLGTVIRELLERVIGRRNAAPAMDTVDVTIENKGTQPVRVILGDGVTDVTIQPNGREQCAAEGYLELRELGNVQQDPNQHEAA